MHGALTRLNMVNWHGALTRLNMVNWALNNQFEYTIGLMLSIFENFSIIVLLQHNEGVYQYLELLFVYANDTVIIAEFVRKVTFT